MVNEIIYNLSFSMVNKIANYYFGYGEGSNC